MAISDFQGVGDCRLGFVAGAGMVSFGEEGKKGEFIYICQTCWVGSVGGCHFGGGWTRCR